MADLGWPELLVIALAAFVFFGWKRLPDAARSVGRSIRVFRSEVEGMRSDDAAAARDEGAAAGSTGTSPTRHEDTGIR